MTHWRKRMDGEMEPHVRCVGAPIRNASGNVVAAINVSSTFKRLPDALSIQRGYRTRVGKPV